MRTRPEDLLVAQILRGQLRLANADIHEALSFRIDPNSEDRIEMSVGDILRTSGWYLLNESDIPAVIDLAERSEVEQEEGTDLPPMPFPRCWFEVRRDSSGLVPIIPFVRPNGLKMRVVGFEVVEEFPGMRWRVITYAESVEHERAVSMFDTSLLRGDESAEQGRTSVGLRPPDDAEASAMAEEERDGLLRALSLPLYIVHLVTAMDVVHAELSTPRPERRRWKREFETDHPRVYFVDLGRCGDAGPSRPTASSLYRHRWIVRGHYRLHPTGTYDLPRGKCVWVRPHAKGPVGAPWKGRPVHRLAEVRG